MRVRKDFTFIAYSSVRRHRSERCLGVTFSPRSSANITVWEWSWSFGFGYNDGPTWYGPWISYMKPGKLYPSSGYWSAGLSSSWVWEQSE